MVPCLPPAAAPASPGLHPRNDSLMGCYMRDACTVAVTVRPCCVLWDHLHPSAVPWRQQMTWARLPCPTCKLQLSCRPDNRKWTSLFAISGCCRCACFPGRCPRDDSEVSRRGTGESAPLPDSRWRQCQGGGRKQWHSGVAAAGGPDWLWLFDIKKLNIIALTACQCPFAAWQALTLHGCAYQAGQRRQVAPLPAW